MALTVGDLLEKLKVIIRITLTGENVPPVKPVLKPSAQRSQLVEDQKSKLKSHIFEVRLQNMMKLKKTSLLPKLIKNPDLLVDCRVKHLLKETKYDEDVWTNGTVLGVEKYFPETPKHLFQVRYEESPEVYVFPLLQDMKKNEMFLLDDISDSKVGAGNSQQQLDAVVGLGC